jgi:hypothetical protein
MHAVDVSNYTSTLTSSALARWKTQHDIGLVIVQAVDPPVGYPTGRTRQQIEACAVAGIETDVYVYLFVRENVEADMRSKLALLNGLEHMVGRVWVDIEDTSAATVAARVSAIRKALAVTDGWSAAHNKPRTGIYGARWYWTAYLTNTTEFSDRDLWAAQYDGIEDTTVFNPFGGWTRCVLKQYAGTSALAGVTGVDLNVVA